MLEATTHRLHDILATTAKEELHLVLKEFGHEATVGEVMQNRPSFLDDSGREVSLYESGILERFAPRMLLASSATAAHPWLLIERIRGRELWQLDDIGPWTDAARLLAALNAIRLPADVSLIEHDASLYAIWQDRALEFASTEQRPAVERLMARCAPLIPRLCEEPRVFLHGEAYASNILVADDGRIVLIDWERAAVGPALLDLACLVAGWDDSTIGLLAAAYRDAMDVEAARSLSDGGFMQALTACRIQQCIQWLGWAPDWTPPQEHRHDWLATAHTLADRLGW